MPLTYGTEQALGTVPKVKTIYLVGVLISIPTPAEEAAGEKGTVTWKYKALDGSGNMIREVEYTEPISQVQGEDAAAFPTIYAAIKAHGYGHVANSGLPAGGTVS